MIAQHNRQLEAQFRRVDRTEFLGQLHEFRVLLVAHERQIAQYRNAPRSRRQRLHLTHEIERPLDEHDAEQSAGEHDHHVLGFSRAMPDAADQSGDQIGGGQGKSGPRAGPEVGRDSGTHTEEHFEWFRYVFKICFFFLNSLWF